MAVLGSIESALEAQDWNLHRRRCKRKVVVVVQLAMER